MSFLVFYVTYPDENTAQKMVSDLLEARLIACGNISTIQSMYYWQNDFCNETECIALLKTSKSKEQETEKFILENHPYDVPCIMRWEATANKSYQNWIEDSVKLKN